MALNSLKLTLLDGMAILTWNIGNKLGGFSGHHHIGGDMRERSAR